MILSSLLFICSNLSIFIIRFNILDFIIDHVFVVFIVVIDSCSCLELFHVNVVILTFVCKFVVIRVIDVINNFKSVPV